VSLPLSAAQAGVSMESAMDAVNSMAGIRFLFFMVSSFLSSPWVRTAGDCDVLTAGRFAAYCRR
jgi:hypothetical protein